MKWLATIVVFGVLGFGVYAFVENREAEGASPKIPVGVGLISTTKPSGQSRLYTILLDVSASRPEAMIFQGRKFVDSVADQMNYGDRLVVLEMYEAGVKDVKRDLDIPINKSEDVTSLEEKERLDGARKGVKDAVGLFFQNAIKKPVVHTDILTTLSIASEKVSPEKHNCLIVLSDMLQSSKEFEFEHLQRLPPSGWINEQKQQGLIRPLYGSSVIIVGADPSAHEGVVVREFWQKYFAASNASLKTENYRTTPPSDASVCD